MGAVVVPYEQIQQAFLEAPQAVQEAVDKSATAAAVGDSQKKARFISRWNQAVASLASADQGSRVLSTPQDNLASRLQTMLVDRASAAGKTNSVVPSSTVSTAAGLSTAAETVQVKFDSNDLIGWIGTGLEILFKPEKALFQAPPAAPEDIPEDAKIALFSDWATGLYGAPIIANTIRQLPRCDVVLHLGDTYY